MATIDRMMKAPVSRRDIFKGLGAGALGMAFGSGLVFGKGALAGIDMLESAGQIRDLAQESESLQEIIDIAITAEALAVTLLGGAVASAEAGNYNAEIPDLVVDVLKAARAEEQFHYDYLAEAGATPLTTTFTIPDPALLIDVDTLFGTIVQLEGAFVAAYMAAARRFAELDQPELVKVAVQTAAVEGEHRVLANYVLGERPANNFGFYPALFDTVGDAAAALQALGFIGGDGDQVEYPGPGKIDASNVTNTMLGGPSVVCSVDVEPPVEPDPACAYFEETGHNVCGIFRDFWEMNGDLPVFGFPVTEAFEEQNFDTGETYLVQYFERQRFEHHPENAGTPYEVLLGRLGAQILAAQGRDWRTFPKGDPNASHYFAETEHAIHPDFWDFWRRYGLNFGDQGVSMRESLALFGYPLSEAAMETNEDGDTVLTQWFERAVFEYHPNNPADQRVLLRRLGVELLELES
ncbi:hypothetical protein BH23CHL2_BH23CHL2_09140 [soil metagenome]